MKTMLLFFIGHCLCSAVFAAGCLRLGVRQRWTALFTVLFFISFPSVFLIFGPWRHYGFYVLDFVSFLGLAYGAQRFYSFLKTQEAVVRYLFWAAMAAFCGAVVLNTAWQLDLRRDPLRFWTYEAKAHPTAFAFDRLAQTYAGSRDFLKARDSWLDAVKLDHRYTAAYEGLLRLAKDQRQWDDVIVYARKVLALNEKNAEAYLDIGEAYRVLGKGRQAVETYSRLLNLFPDDENVDMKVIEAYGRAIAQDPQNSVYKEKREEVLADFEQLSKRKNYNAVDYYNLGFLYEQVGGKEEAMRFYGKAVEMKPDYKEALFNLANLYRDSGNYKVAMALYERLTHFHPHFALGYLNMGVIFNALGDQQRARQLYLKALDLDPSNGDAYFDLGYLSESQGELSEAVNYYEKAVEVAPKNAEAYYNLGNVYASLGQTGEAIASYLKTVAINPRHQDAFVNLSILSFKSRDFQGAIHYLADAQALGYNAPVEYLKTLEPYKK